MVAIHAVAILQVIKGRMWLLLAYMQPSALFKNCNLM